MEYLVIGADGQEYGPVNMETLKQWVADNRVGADTNLKEFQTGRTIPARSVPFLFAPPAVASPAAGPYSTPPASYPREGMRPSTSDNAGLSDVLWSLFRSALALIFFFALGGIGIIIAIYGLVYAIRGYQAGHKLGIVAIVISVITLIVIGIGWMVRLSAHHAT